MRITPTQARGLGRHRRRRPPTLEQAKRARPEAEVVQAILDYLLLIPQAHVYRVRELAGPDGRYRQGAFEGCPDIAGWITYEDVSVRSDQRFYFGAPAVGVALYIEVKRPRGRRRPAQVVFIENARLTGCIAFFAESVEDVRTELRRWGVNAP